MSGELTREQKLELLHAARQHLKKFALLDYRPYPKQLAFHNFGATCKERLLRAGNQQGKTHAGAMEMALHSTGQYPEWWQGRRFNHPVEAWVACDTSETTRDNPQRALIGAIGEWGTGAIPADCLDETLRGRGVADLVDTVLVRHVSGGQSRVGFKNYLQGRTAWQGTAKYVIWCDEEPPLEIYSEALARLVATGGCIYTTFTPLKGMSEVVRRLLHSDGSNGAADVNMTIEEAEHIAASERERIVSAFPDYEREARAYGVPILGSGRVFAEVMESDLRVEPFQVPRHWPQIGGMDFGWDHPFAAIRLAWDRDADTVYVTNAFRVAKQTPVLHAAALRAMGRYLTWAWPHDGLQHDKGSGDTLAAQYKREGLRMLARHATHADGGYGFEAGVSEMLMRMQTGRFKVFATLSDWFEEFRTYHRKDGRVVKEHDDLLSATRVAVMSLRYARVPDAAVMAPAIADGFYDPLEGIPRPSDSRARGRFGMPIDVGSVYPSDAPRTIEENDYDPLAPLGTYETRH